MPFIAILTGFALTLFVLWDTFETMILPRTVRRQFRLTRLYYSATGGLWQSLLRHLWNTRLRETLLNAFGPLSLIMLIVFWAFALILSFGLMHWGLGTSLLGSETPQAGLGTNLYFSGVTFLTLGFGDITPHTSVGRTLAVLEAGVGFGFLAVVISYLPILYQSFSKREITITLLDARAGSPPTAVELLRRYAKAQDIEGLIALLNDLEKWSAEMLESYLSFPILAFYRSQHSDESWLGALTALLDACALISLDFQGDPEWRKRLRWQAHLTFAMARHAVVDLSLILYVPPMAPEEDRLPEAEWRRLCEDLAKAGIRLCDDETARAKLVEIRRQYEPYLFALSRRLFVTLPPWSLDQDLADNWQTSAWDNETHLSGRAAAEK